MPKMIIWVVVNNEMMENDGNRLCMWLYLFVSVVCFNFAWLPFYVWKICYVEVLNRRWDIDVVNEIGGMGVCMVMLVVKMEWISSTYMCIIGGYFDNDYIVDEIERN